MIRVTPYQLVQWKLWLEMRRPEGKADAARAFGLPADESREIVLTHVNAALGACLAADAGLHDTVELDWIR